MKVGPYSPGALPDTHRRQMGILLRRHDTRGTAWQEDRKAIVSTGEGAK